MEEDEGVVVDHSQQLRSFTVAVGEVPTADPNYPVGYFLLEEGGEDPSRIAVILIADIDGKLLCAFPQCVWHRTVARRRLQAGTLKKPVPVQVSAVDRSPEADEGHSSTLQIWLGYLAAELEVCVEFDSSEDAAEPTVLFSDENPFLVPSAADLLRLSEEYFSFQTAVSSSAAAAGGRDLDKRVSSVEKTLSEISASLAQIVEQKRSPVLPSPILPATAAARDLPEAACPPPPGLARMTDAKFGNLDPEVVQSAKMAGIPEEQIAEMSRLALRGRPQLGDLPRKKTALKPKTNVLSESEDDAPEAVEPNLGDNSQPADLGSAILQLTRIASHLAGDKKKAGTLDAILDGGTASSTDSSSSSTSRKSAAALRMLRRTLLTNPKQIYQVIEQNMEDDFSCRTQMPGSAAVPCTARAWLEMRSKVQLYQTPVRLLWGIAGILDCLRVGDADAARARAALLLCQGDQLSIDRGSWLVAGELSLEDSPPLASFSSHTLPSEAEPPYTKLVDGRWMDLVLQRLSDFESLTEKKRKLNTKKTHPASEDSSKADPNPKRKAKGGKGKDGKGGGKQRTGDNENASGAANETA